MLFYLFACLALASANPVQHLRPSQNFQTRVINGQAATPGQFPWQVSLQRFGRHFCGGSLISTLYVVSAAHCQSSPVKVGLGGNVYSGAMEQYISQGTFTPHPQYDDLPFDYDYAVIKLAQNADLSSNNVDTITMAAQGEEYPEGTIGTISGWGYTDGTVQVVSDTLQWTNIPLVSQQSCQSTWGLAAIRITDRMQCVGGNGVSSCMGDSGGPLTVENAAGETILIGIASWAESTCNSNYPVGYAKISAVRDWFFDQTGI